MQLLGQRAVHKGEYRIDFSILLIFSSMLDPTQTKNFAHHLCKFNVASLLLFATDVRYVILNLEHYG